MINFLMWHQNAMFYLKELKLNSNFLEEEKINMHTLYNVSLNNIEI